MSTSNGGHEQILLLLLSACSTVQPNKDTDKITVIGLGDKISKKCGLIGDVKGDQVGRSSMFSGDKGVEEGAINSLRNNTKDMGANAVLILKTINGTQDNFPFKDIKTEVHHTGKAFLCPVGANGLPEAKWVDQN